jgi:uncharacterized Rossmann fold enzyme
MTRIEELKKLPLDRRKASLERMFRKNQMFFRENYPSVGRVVRPGAADPFHITVTDDFIEITNKQTGELCHPETGLDKFAATLGDWTHSAWSDLIEGNFVVHPESGSYSQFPTRFQQAIVDRYPGIYERMKKRVINLPTLADGKRFSNSVIFAGVFHGLHVDYYLSRTVLYNAAFIEPDVSRFVLSCYFLDYQNLHKRFDGLILHIGDEFPQRHIKKFFDKAKHTTPVWIRVLPGYASEKVEPMMRKVRLDWRKMYDAWFPADHLLDAMCNAVKNISTGQRVFNRHIELSEHSRIAVVGSGPSLNSDLPWLKKYQDQLIIFAAHSSVSPLQQEGITPDFQFNVETFPWSVEKFQKFNLDKNIPIVTLLGDVPDKFSGFRDVFLLPETGSVQPIKIKETIPFLTPTTGNTEIGFACFCSPSQIYLLGLDFGFRHSVKTHVEGGSYHADETDQKKGLGLDNVEVKANFSDAGAVFTRPYFNLARQHAEYAVARVEKKTSVFNCSDGAFVSGANPCRSSEIVLSGYDKADDIKAIHSMFAPLEEGKHWHRYSVDGETLLKEYKKRIRKELQISEFDWLDFVARIENLKGNVERQLPDKFVKKNDNRIFPYMTVIDELLVAWYRMLCFTNNEDEWQQVYDAGYTVVCDLVEEMTWDVDDSILSRVEEKIHKHANFSKPAD